MDNFLIYQDFLKLPSSVSWASAEILRQRQNTALLGSLDSVTLHITDIHGISLFRAELSGCKGQKFGLMVSSKEEMIIF